MIGRPKIEIDQNELIKLMEFQCTEEDIAGFYEVSVDTINNRCKEYFECTFSEAIKRYSNAGKCSLRRWQWAAAKDGKIPMLIWLGKQYLGQTDKTETVNTHDFKQGLKVGFDADDDGSA